MGINLLLQVIVRLRALLCFIPSSTTSISSKAMVQGDPLIVKSLTNSLGVVYAGTSINAGALIMAPSWLMDKSRSFIWLYRLLFFNIVRIGFLVILTLARHLLWNLLEFKFGVI